MWLKKRSSSHQAPIKPQTMDLKLYNVKVDLGHQIDTDEFNSIVPWILILLDSGFWWNWYFLFKMCTVVSQSVGMLTPEYCPFPCCWEFFILLNHAQFLLMITPYWTILLTCWFVVPWVQLMAEEREAGGPLCIIAMSFSFLVSVPILETVRLNLFQETLLSAPHLVGMFPAVKKRKNKLRLQQHPTAFYRSNQEILKGYWTGRKTWRVCNCFYIYIF